METKYNKTLYKKYKKDAKESGVKFFTFDTTGKGYPYNGVSVAYIPSVMGNQCKMVEVSVSYCALEDEFKNKRGKFQALNKMFMGEVIKLPLGAFFRDCGSNNMKKFLTGMFTV